jgi:soluble lytic murein transglycosylase-like protein
VTFLRKRNRTLLSALAALAFLVLSLHPAPSHTAIADPHDLPTAFDPALAHRELARWMVGRGFPVMAQTAISPADLAAALRPQAQARKLGLFRSELAAGAAAAAAAEAEHLRLLPYGSILIKTAERNHVDGLLLASVVEAESGFVSDAISPEGAVGLMQLLPSTGSEYGIRDLSEPHANLDAGSRYLGGLLHRFNHDLELAIAAYNAGPEVVARYRRVPPYRETRDFVHRVMALYQDHRDAVNGRTPRPASPVRLTSPATLAGAPGGTAGALALAQRAHRASAG